MNQLEVSLVLNPKPTYPAHLPFRRLLVSLIVNEKILAGGGQVRARIQEAKHQLSHEHGARHGPSPALTVSRSRTRQSFVKGLSGPGGLCRAPAPMAEGSWRNQTISYMLFTGETCN